MNKIFVYTLKIFPYVAPKKEPWFADSKIRPKLHHILVLLSERFTIFWCNSPLIMVQFRTNFCSQQISASFWCNVGQKFLECTAYGRNFLLVNFRIFRLR